MTWCSSSVPEDRVTREIDISVSPPPPPQLLPQPPPSAQVLLSSSIIDDQSQQRHGQNDDVSDQAVMNAKVHKISCPSCGRHIDIQDQGGFIQELPGLPAGVKFDPTDQEIVQHLEAKVIANHKLHHPLIDEFIPTLEGENGICYTHPEKLPGVRKDGLIRHFFHRPSKAYTTGTRKRRKVSTDEEGGETRWHKTGKTRPVFINGEVKGFKKILVLYTNYGRQRKPEKTNWVMHQYHIGSNEEEKDGELVVSKVFYQTQPRQCGSVVKDMNQSSSLMIEPPPPRTNQLENMVVKNNNVGYVEFYNPAHHHHHQFMGYGGSMVNEESSAHQLMQNVVVHGDGSSIIQLGSNASKEITCRMMERK
ncbi:unnamed protein product [Rhodiola kirilowii]